MRLNKRRGIFKAIWKIVVVDGILYDNYLVSNLGQIKSLNYRRTNKTKIMKFKKHSKGYNAIDLFNNGVIKRNVLVHRIVAEVFISTKDINLHIDHINTNRSNNRVYNLRWVTQLENNNNPISKSKKKERANKKVRCIETGIIYNSITEASKFINRHIGSLSRCLNGKHKKCGGYHWEYVTE